MVLYGEPVSYTGNIVDPVSECLLIKKWNRPAVNFSDTPGTSTHYKRLRLTLFLWTILDTRTCARIFICVDKVEIFSLLKLISFFVKKKRYGISCGVVCSFLLVEQVTYKTLSINVKSKQNNNVIHYNSVYYTILA